MPEHRRIDELIRDFRELAKREPEMSLAWNQVGDGEALKVQGCWSPSNRQTFRALAVDAISEVDPDDYGNRPHHSETRWLRKVLDTVPELVVTRVAMPAEVLDGEEREEVLLVGADIRDICAASALALSRLRRRIPESADADDSPNQAAAVTQAQLDAIPPLDIKSDDWVAMSKLKKSDFRKTPFLKTASIHTMMSGEGKDHVRIPDKDGSKGLVGNRAYRKAGRTSNARIYFLRSTL